MKYSKPEDVLEALEIGSVKEVSLKQYISKLKKQEQFDKVSIIEEGITLWKNKELEAMCTFYNKPIDKLSLSEILDLYDKDKRLLTTNHCVRFTILMTLDSFISIKDYKGLVLHPRDLYLEDELPYPEEYSS